MNDDTAQSTRIQELKQKCENGDVGSCELLRRMGMIKNGFAEGGLLADASRTWRMEAEYPEFEKGVANRLSKERVPAAEIEEQFNYSPLQRGYAEGGEIDFDTEGSMLDPEIPLNFEEDYSDRGEASDFPAFEEEILAEDEEDILTGLSPEDQEILFQAMSDYPELEGILNTISANDSSASFDTEVFDEEGSVEGPGTGISDSIPANLSDGEFVFTAKSVKQLGVDKLRKMMAKAETDYDEADNKQQFAQMGDVGFAAGGLLTRANSFEYGGYTKSKEEFPEGSYAIEDEGTSTGELTPGIGKETLQSRGNPHIGEESIIGRKPGEPKYIPADYGITDKSRRGLGTRIKEELENRIRKELRLDPVTYIPKGKDGKPTIHRESSLLTVA